MNDTTQYVGAVRDYRDALAKAKALDDDTMSPAALQTRKRELVEEARTILRAKRPPLPPIPARDSILDALRPTTADDYAALRHEQEKITRLLEAGRRLTDVLNAGDSARALAIVDMAETMPEVLSSNDGAQIVAEYRAAAFEKLAELGVAPAIKLRALELEWAAPIAWHDVMSNLAEGEASIGPWQGVFLADREGYDASGGVADPNDGWAASLT